jgi:aspartate kinase
MSSTPNWRARWPAPSGRAETKYPSSLVSTPLSLPPTHGPLTPPFQGYFGVVPGGLLEKIGRGYTDLCAALVAVGIEASELQVWKEVDGIFTADPRKVPTARLLASITPAEAAELTFYGSEVIHPFTMEQVIRARIPIRIKNVMNPSGSGTLIYPDPPPSTATPSRPSTPSSLSLSSSTSSLFRALRSPTSLSSSSHQTLTSSVAVASSVAPKRPTAVTIKHQILVINVHSNKRSLSHGFFAKIFSTLDKWRLSVDLISTSEVHVSMALHSESSVLLSGTSPPSEANTSPDATASHARAPPAPTSEEDLYERELLRIRDADLRGAIAELRHYGTVDLIPNMAILSLVGKQMKNMPGIAGRMFSVLGEHGVNIEMISQGMFRLCLSFRGRVRGAGAARGRKGKGQCANATR